MIVRELADKLGLEAVAGKQGMEKKITGGYSGDLLSDVMGKAPEGCIWLTVQGHQNVIAIAVLKEMAAIVLTGDHEPDEDTIEKANQENIPLLLYPESAFVLAGRIYESGIGKTG
ncbi:DRTGG domain-containing protein [Desulfonema limicola]|uniref:DRTGG domain-containing protein n=1 Tax=Desulfonema limicola TaxID=45656 RepID=A0A975B682_9BACT|nr:DRTGG domain-containing protein [Desulfonema limicola]QTA79583.1 DRTGG domain-containing protein [Desulfonema limicola]